MKKYKQSKIKVYISGDMNDANYNFNFEEAERILTENGFEVLNPCTTFAKLAGMGEIPCAISGFRLLVQAGVMVQVSDTNKNLRMQFEEELAGIKKIAISNYLLDQKPSK